MENIDKFSERSRRGLSITTRGDVAYLNLKIMALDIEKSI